MAARWDAGQRVGGGCQGKSGKAKGKRNAGVLGKKGGNRKGRAFAGRGFRKEQKRSKGGAYQFQPRYDFDSLLCFLSSEGSIFFYIYIFSDHPETGTALGSHGM